MKEVPTPKITISKCIEFDHCRYNGQIISSDIVGRLNAHVDFVAVCPEVEIGLGVPRQPIRIVSGKRGLELVQPATGRDVSKPMRLFANAYLSNLSEVDGFLLKSRSPSCGIKDVKIYPGIDAPKSSGRGAGFFGGAVLERFASHPTEDECRLTNSRIREHFLTAVYTFARYRSIARKQRMRDLVAFHAENKLLIMARGQRALRVLDQVVANHERKPVREIVRHYGERLRDAFIRPPRYTSNINVLMHALGYFSKQLPRREKSFFLDSLEVYRAGAIPLSSCTTLVRSWIIRFGEPCLMKQTYFEPFPLDLIDIGDSGKGRERI